MDTEAFTNLPKITQEESEGTIYEQGLSYLSLLHGRITRRLT